MAFNQGNPGSTPGRPTILKSITGGENMASKIYKSISRLCAEKGLTISVLERKLGFGKSTIAKWKTAEPGAEKLAAVAKRLGVSMEALIYGEEPGCISGSVTVLHSGEAVCGGVFETLAQMERLILDYGGGTLNIEICKDGVEMGQAFSSSTNAGLQE